MNLLLYTGYLVNIPIALEEAARVDGASTWTDFLEDHLPDYEADACDGCGYHSSCGME